MKLKKVVEYAHHRVVEEMLEHLRRNRGTSLFDCPMLRKRVDASMEKKLVELCSDSNDFSEDDLRKVSRFAAEMVEDVAKTFVDAENLSEASSIAHFSRVCPNCPFHYEEPIEACLFEKRDDLCIDIDLPLLDVVERYFLEEKLPIEDLHLSIDSLIIDLQHEGISSFKDAEEKSMLIKSMEKALKKNCDQCDSDDAQTFALKLAPFILTRIELMRRYPE